MKTFFISTDKSKLDLDTIHGFLSKSYWADGRTRETIQKSIDNSICFGVYLDEEQIGFARVVSDYSIFAYIMDVFILEEYRGNGYSKQLMHAITTYEDTCDCENWFLRTKDAQGLYSQFGFVELEFPERTMHRKRT